MMEATSCFGRTCGKPFSNTCPRSFSMSFEVFVGKLTTIVRKKPIQFRTLFAREANVSSFIGTEIGPTKVGWKA